MNMFVVIANESLGYGAPWVATYGPFESREDAQEAADRWMDSRKVKHEIGETSFAVFGTRVQRLTPKEEMPA